MNNVYTARRRAKLKVKKTWRRGDPERMESMARQAREKRLEALKVEADRAAPPKKVKKTEPAPPLVAQEEVAVAPELLPPVAEEVSESKKGDAFQTQACRSDVSCFYSW